METPTTEPTSFRAGDSIAWSRTLADYSAADGWVLKYRLLWPQGPAVDITTTGALTVHSVSLTPTETASFAPGSATLLSYVQKSDGSQRRTLGAAPVTILPDLTTPDLTHDGRSANQIALDDARAALAAYLKKGQLHVAEYDIAGRTMKFRDVDQITALIQYYEREVFKETANLAALNGTAPGRVQVRF